MSTDVFLKLRSGFIRILLQARQSRPPHNPFSNLEPDRSGIFVRYWYSDGNPDAFEFDPAAAWRSLCIFGARGVFRFGRMVCHTGHGI